jgi:hypothetical protein
MKEWNVAPLLTAEMFAFTPPAGAQQIDFEQVWEKAAELKAAKREEVSSR